ncbi:MAG: hypothetical protein ACYCO5_06845, partial [Acidobacteriaceae bacterium]
EAHILCKVPAGRLESFYQQCIVPLKSRLDTDYMEAATLLSDIGVLLATVLRLGKHVTHEDLVQSNGRPHLWDNPQSLRIHSVEN